MDVSNLTKTSSVTPIVTKAVGDSSGGKSPVAAGNSLPDAGQARVHTEDPLAKNPVSPSSSEELNNEELSNLVNHVNVALQGHSSDLKFTVVEGTDISVVRVEDAKTGEVIRQFPSEETVAFARALDESQQGTMFEEKA